MMVYNTEHPHTDKFTTITLSDNPCFQPPLSTCYFFLFNVNNNLFINMNETFAETSLFFVNSAKRVILLKESFLATFFAYLLSSFHNFYAITLGRPRIGVPKKRDGGLPLYTLVSTQRYGFWDGGIKFEVFKQL